MASHTAAHTVGQTVGHTKSYVKVLVPLDPRLVGCVARVRVHAVHRWHVEGTVLRCRMLIIEVAQELTSRFLFASFGFPWARKSIFFFLFAAAQVETTLSAKP